MSGQNQHLCNLYMLWCIGGVNGIIGQVVIHPPLILVAAIAVQALSPATASSMAAIVANTFFIL